MKNNQSNITVNKNDDLALNYVNREYADSVFRTYFRDEKRLISLYSALTEMPENEIKTLEIKTLENVIYGHRKNDLAALVNHAVIILAEHQTTINGYMPVRMSQYIAEILNKMLDAREIYKRSVKNKLPIPKFYVLYSGREEYPIEQKEKLSDLFVDGYDDDCSIELTAKVININYDKGHELLNKCIYVHDYALFIHTVRQYQKTGCSNEVSVNKAVDECISNGVMSDFLIEYGREVQHMLTRELSLEEIIEVYKEDAREMGLEEGRTQGHKEGLAEGRTQGLAEGRTQGLAEGRTQGLAEGRTQGLAEGRTQGLEKGRAEGMEAAHLNDARMFKAKGIPVNLIAECTGLSLDIVEAI